MCLAVDSTVCFLPKTGPCKPTVTRPQAGVELPPFWVEQNALTVSVFAGLKKLSFRQGVSARPSTAVEEQIPRDAGESGRSGTRSRRCRGDSKMDPVMVDRCVERGPERRIRQSPRLPDPACPVRNRKVGRPYHFSAVAASNEATLRTQNAAVTKNSTVMRRGFWRLAARRACAGAHVTTTLRLPVTRAASERGKMGASLQAVTPLLSVSPACVPPAIVVAVLSTRRGSWRRLVPRANTTDATQR